jgi:hypothetical protein
MDSSVAKLQEHAIWTPLYPWEEELAYRVGAGRDRENQGKGDRASYDASKLMPDNILANVHASSAEIGACRLIGAYCYAGIWDVADHKTYSALPDGLWGINELEIKWRRSSGSMPVDKKDADAGRLVLWVESKLAEQYNCVCDFCASKTKNQLTTVRILGGGFADRLWSLGDFYNGDTQRVAVKAQHLTPIKEILASKENW